MLGNYKNLVVLGQKRDFPLHRLRVPTSRGRHSTAETGAVCCHCEPSPAEGSVGGAHYISALWGVTQSPRFKAVLTPRKATDSTSHMGSCAYEVPSVSTLWSRALPLPPLAAQGLAQTDPSTGALLWARIDPPVLRTALTRQ